LSAPPVAGGTSFGQFILTSICCHRRGAFVYSDFVGRPSGVK